MPRGYQGGAYAGGNQGQQRSQRGTTQRARLVQRAVSTMPTRTISTTKKNASCGWRANAPPRAVSEAPAKRRRGCARLTPGAERRASPQQQTTVSTISS